MFVSPLVALLAAAALLLLGLLVGRSTAKRGPLLGASLKRQKINGVTVLDGALTGRAGRRAHTELSVYFVLKRAPREASTSAAVAADAAV